ncbi:hypothetical protein QAD02_016840 [Eretmocerus hayati]|uniref:Uncharacterized protein n=1 Tax=Eretmocerus hayati TaxID=131215 RepID=A0ACC2PC77_9HYME|nr:hypothetical protein QAD02_016840 [Eretmocerus hayati]
MLTSKFRVPATRPRIDPLSLLRCLSVLLGPNGGIKSKEEVIRLANLMTKFSKKLVSKCIYIQILKSTDPDLLNQFMANGGWNLIHMWLTDGILVKNWALIQELLELLLLCPVDIERLKSNNCPKLIKGLSKEGSHMGVRTLASKLVEQWLKMVKGESGPNAVIVQSGNAAIQSHTPLNSSVQSVESNVDTSLISQKTDSEKIASVPSCNAQIVDNLSSAQTAPVQTPKNSSKLHTSPNNSFDKSQATPLSVSPPSVYKITIRDGKQVLTQVQTDAANINAISSDSRNSIVKDNVDAAPSEDDNTSAAPSDNEEVSIDRKNHVTEVTKDISSEVKKGSNIPGSVDNVDEFNNKDTKDEKDVTSDSCKSTSDKENRDKKDEKKAVGVSLSSDRKNNHAASSSKSSNKHSSSSTKHSSSKHSSSSHRSSSKSSSSSSRSSRDKDRDKDKHHSSSSKSSSSRPKTEREKERDKEKEKMKKEIAEKDKATLEKLQSQSLSMKMGKIPKKKADEEKPSDSPSRKSSTDSKESCKENKVDPKKPASVVEKKNISISIENRKNSQDQQSRPKTVKTFNSKFRSTGLEEEIKPPPPRGAKKPPIVPDKKVILPKIPLKRPSPVKEVPTAEKKIKLSLDPPPTEEKKGGIKLIAPKPKLMLLQENDMFMDALTASATKSKEPRKRKRRTSITKDGPSDPKKTENANGENNGTSPPSSPISSPPAANKDADDKSLIALKPTFKFYQDTLETDEDKDAKCIEKTEESEKDADVAEGDVKKEKREPREGDEDEGSRTPTPEDDFDDSKGSESPGDPAAAVSEALKKEEQSPGEPRPIGALKSVLLLQKRKGPKKSLKWKADLESIRFFELDETERVNVTKTFTDMKNMEKMNEREAFQMARKLSSEDVMEERTLWKPLIPIDLPLPLVEPGKDSREKDIQYAREKGILQALYFNRNMIPDSASEPDEERHHVFMEPKIIPLDDLTGNKDSEKDFSHIPWPEPKPQLPAPATILSSSYFQSFRTNPQQALPPMNAQPPMATIPQQIVNPMQQMVPEVTTTVPPAMGGGGGWRTGDGKIVVPDPTIPPMGYASNMDSSGMVQQNMMTPQMYGQDGYAMAPEEMGYNYQGPPGPNMYGPPGHGGPPPVGPGPPGPPYQGPRGPPRGRGWYRGGPPRGMPWRGGWRGGSKSSPVCRQFSKNGYCRAGDKCQFLHPGQNCPPY